MDNKVTSLIVNLGVAIIAIIGIVLVIYAMGNTAEIDPITQQANADTSTVSNVVSFSLITFWIAVGAIGIFTLFAIVTNPKRFIPTAIGIAIFAVVILIGYSMAEVETTGKILDLEGATDSNLLMGGIGIKTTYILVFIAITLIILQGFRNLLGYFKK